jgi:ribonuclease Z
VIKTIFCCLLLLTSFAGVLETAQAQTNEIKVTLLGTGCPPPVMNRFGPSILVEAGNKKFLFDAGRGAMQRLLQIGVRWQDVEGVFFTHLHSDHVVGFPDLYLTGWLFVPGRSLPLRVWGPRGTTDMISHIEQAFAFDVHIRELDEHVSPEGARIIAKDIEEGVVYDEGGVKITAFEVDHGLVKPAFGYRVDYGKRSIVLSGDTRFSENLIEHSRGVDLLVHEVIAPDSLRRLGIPPERLKAIVARHTTPEKAADVFNATKPRLAVFSHIADPTASEQEIIPPTRLTYAGPLELGEDLMVIEVGEKISVRRPKRAATTLN